MKNALFAFLISLLPGALPAQITPINYNQAQNWAAHPMKLFDLSIKPSYTLISVDTMVKTVVTVPYNVNSNYDIFAVYPTTLIDLDKPAGTINVDNIVYKSAANLAVQLSFTQLGQFGRIYAPYYRQANLPTFALPSAQNALQGAILDTAATDVLAAFLFYMQHNNNGKKVILAGHSQGAILLSMLLYRLEQTPAYKPYLDKIFVSVLAGMEGCSYTATTAPYGGFIQYTSLCQNPLDTACIMTWGTYKYGLPFTSTPPGNHLPTNLWPVYKNWKFTAYTPVIHHQSGDPLRFSSTPQASGRSIYPTVYVSTGTSGVTTDFVAYDSMYQIRVENPTELIWGLSAQRVLTSGDHRFDPTASAVFADLHIYDMQLLIGDVSTLICRKMHQCSVAPFTLNSFGLTASCSDVSQNAISRHWDFGDGTGSQETNPQHTYAAAGQYEICLSVQTACEQAEFCQIVQVQPDAVYQASVPATLAIFPNPASESIDFPVPETLQFLRLFDASGTVIITRTTPETSLNIDFLPGGLYVLELFTVSGKHYVGRFFK